MKSLILLCSSLAISSAWAGPYPPKAGAAGSDAISKSSPAIVAWANGWLPVQYGTDVDDIWKTPAKALGKALGDPYDIVCLGNGGRITLVFPHPVMDGAGADFAVFENAFGDTFLELAFVEVSSDGVNFFRFPTASLTPGTVGAFGSVNPTNLSGFAGKYIQGYGTPFDLASLADSPLLDKQHVRFVRIVDIIGDGNAKDSEGRAIYDPWPVTGSGGFDLDAIAVIHQNDGAFRITRAEISGGAFQLEWESNPGSRYRIETSTTLTVADWLPVEETPGTQTSGRTARGLAISGGPKRFWRVVRLAD
jgi:hypothetical protein